MPATLTALQEYLLDLESVLKAMYLLSKKDNPEAAIKAKKLDDDLRTKAHKILCFLHTDNGFLAYIESQQAQIIKTKKTRQVSA